MAVSGEEHPLGGTFTPFHHREGSGHRRTSCFAYRISSTSARWGASNRKFTSAKKHFRRGFPVVGSSSRWYFEVHCCARALWSPCNVPPPGNDVVAILHTSGGRRSMDAGCFLSDCCYLLTHLHFYCTVVRFILNQVWAVIVGRCSHLDAGTCHSRALAGPQ